MILVGTKGLFYSWLISARGFLYVIHKYRGVHLLFLIFALPKYNLFDKFHLIGFAVWLNKVTFECIIMRMEWVDTLKLRRYRYVKRVPTHVFKIRINWS